MDPECIPLVEAMNTLIGIYTFESCCGHGKRPFCIFFVAESLYSLPQLLYWFDKHYPSTEDVNGVDGWDIKAYTDCNMNKVRFMVTSTTKGEQAYAEANKIANFINKNDR